MHVSENSIVQWQLTDFLQANGHHVSICLPFLGKSATADLFLWLRMCIRDAIGMFLSVGICRFPMTWDLVPSASLLVNLGSAHCWNISSNWNFLQIPKIWTAANLHLPLVTRVMCKQQQLADQHPLRAALVMQCPDAWLLTKTMWAKTFQATNLDILTSLDKLDTCDLNVSAESIWALKKR